MNMDKYYTPNIEEFHVGFEYELRTLKGWEKRVFNSNDGYCNNVSDIEMDILEDNIRVKYLDKEDIESFDFKFKKDSYSRMGYKSWEFEITDFHGRIHPDYSYTYWNIYLKQDYHEHSTHLRTITIKADVNDGIIKEKFFEGIILNKSELRKLLKQLNIIYNI